MHGDGIISAMIVACIEAANAAVPEKIIYARAGKYTTHGDERRSKGMR
jgi:hypothetical protein